MTFSTRKPIHIYKIGSLMIFTISLLVVSTISVNGDTIETKIVAPDGSTNDYFGSSVSISGDLAVIGAFFDSDLGPSSGSAYIYRWDGVNWNFEEKLLPSDGVASDWFGRAVAISGNRVIVGASGVDTKGPNSGAAYIFELEGSNWVEQKKLIASDGSTEDRFGNSVGISNTRVIVGSEGESDDGAAYVFSGSGLNWHEDDKLVASDGQYGDGFGHSVSISFDTIVVGAYQKDTSYSDAGAVYIFDWDGTHWVEETKLLANDGRTDDSFGKSLAIDNNRIIVSAEKDDDKGPNSGSTYVFHKEGSIWVQKNKLTASDGSGDENFGSAVAIGANLILVGSHLDDDLGSNSGSSYLFEFDGQNWVEQMKLNAIDGSSFDYYGSSLAINGRNAIIGAPSNNDLGSRSGSVYFYNFDSNLSPPPSKTELEEFKITASDGEPEDHFGYSVAIDGNIASVGVPWDGATNAGMVYIYNWDGTNWIEHSKLVASDGSPAGWFGWSVDIENDILVIGAPRDSSKGTQSGSVYVFKWNGFNWIEQAKLTASDGDSIDSFGGSVSVSGDIIVVGAYLDESLGSSSGSAYVYKWNGANWMETAKLLASDGKSSSVFGASVSADGDRIAIGSPFNDVVGTKSGSMYIFEYVGSEWLEQVKLIPNDGAAEDQFGMSVSLSGDFAVAGAHSDDDLGTDSGSVYFFHWDGSNWIQQEKLIADDGSSGDWFGRFVSIDANTVVIGAPFYDTSLIADEGAAYIYTWDGSIWYKKFSLKATEGNVKANFGWAVAIDADNVLISAFRNDDLGTNSGSAYVYNTGFNKIKPVVIAPSNMVVEATSSAGAQVNFVATATDDIDGAISVTCYQNSGQVFPLGYSVVYCTSIDSDGNVGRDAFSITVVDTTAPEITLPSNMIIEANSSAGAEVSFSVVADDVVDGSVTVLCDYNSGYNFAIGSTIVECTAQDTTGNLVTDRFTVMVVDSTAPTVIVPDDLIVEATSPTGVEVIFSVFGFDIVDGNLPVTCNGTSGDQFSLGVTTIICSTSDSSGNTGSSSFLITVIDSNMPLINVPDDIISEATSTDGAQVSFAVTAYDIIDGVLTPQCNYDSGQLFLLGTTIIQCSVLDSHGNVGNANFSIFVVDTTEPILIFPADITVEAISNLGSAIEFVATAEDLVDGLVVTICNASSGDMFPIGITSVECSAKDNSGNVATGIFTIHIVDTSAPYIIVPAPIILEAINSSGLEVIFSVNASDSVDGDVDVSCNYKSGDVFPIGLTFVECTAVDNTGNLSSASFSISVVDSTNPNISTPEDMIVEATSIDGSIVFFEVEAEDNIDGYLTVLCNITSGDLFPLGITIVECIAYDKSLNVASSSFIVEVIDSVVPVINIPGNITIETYSTNGEIVTFNVSAVDNIDGEVSVECNYVSGDLFPIGSTNVVCNAQDKSGNIDTANFTISIVEIATISDTDTDTKTNTKTHTKPANFISYLGLFSSLLLISVINLQSKLRK